MRIPRFVRYSLLALIMMVIPASSFAGVFISVRIGPPPLPVYVQPACPGDGYMWTPGYWAYGDAGYYWVPGTWVLAPQPGYLWTPGYWGWNEGLYVWHAGYWGPHVGFYGGINYGFGYFGAGYAGGYWHGRDFFYNRSVNNVTITNVHIYNRTVINNVRVNRVSYNGGVGGINARPSHDEERWGHERHFEPTSMQVNHEHGARDNREFLASVNHGRPAIAATSRPNEFHGHDFTPSRPEAGFRPAPGNRESREVPRPENSARHNERGNMSGGNGHSNMDRPMPRPDNRGDYRNQAPRTENRGHSDVAPHPTAYHPGNNGQHGSMPHENSVSHGNGNGGQHGNAPRGEKEDHGRH